MCASLLLLTHGIVIPPVEGLQSRFPMFTTSTDTRFLGQRPLTSLSYPRFRCGLLRFWLRCGRGLAQGATIQHDNGLPRAFPCPQIARMHVLPRHPAAPCLLCMLRSNCACDFGTRVISMSTSITHSFRTQSSIYAVVWTVTICESLKPFLNPPLHNVPALLISQTALSAVSTCSV